MAIIVLQHSEHCSPGRIGTTLRDHGFHLDVRRLDLGEPVPAGTDGVDAVVSLGGPQNIGEDHAWMEGEAALLRAAHERALPIVGVCLGAQLIAHALGGSVGPMAKPEIGMVDMHLLPAGQTDTILAGVAWDSPQFQCHKHEVRDLPPGAVLLASSDACKVQVFRAGMRCYGFQYHLEADVAMMREITRNRVSEFREAGSSPEQFERDLDEKGERFARLADRVCLNIATCLIPRVASAVTV